MAVHDRAHARSVNGIPRGVRPGAGRPDPSTNATARHVPVSLTLRSPRDEGRLRLPLAPAEGSRDVASGR